MSLEKDIFRCKCRGIGPFMQLPTLKAGEETRFEAVVRHFEGYAARRLGDGDSRSRRWYMGEAEFDRFSGLLWVLLLNCNGPCLR
jgi:hypothetical protein